MRFNSDIVRKYLNGNFSLNDKTTIDEFFEKEQYANELNETLSEYWKVITQTKIDDDKNLVPILDKITHRILLQSKEDTSKIRLLWQLYSRVASILLLPILIFSFFHYLNLNKKHQATTWVEIHSPYGARTRFSLPDGSTGWLNSGSVISYPSQFGVDRTVTLNGEAYFDVVKNPNSPFIIDAKPVTIKVLGTSFNVVSYDNDSISEVTVASGKVEVETEGQKIKQNLLPSERLVVNRLKNTLTKSTVNVQSYTSWKTGKLIFLNDNLDEVVRKASRFYNVDFEVKNNVNRKELFRAILEDESLEEVLRYMKLTMSVDYAIQERKQDQDSRISKRKVIITNVIKN
ncbi:MAG TPA: FecR domain-containing protein [Prolixibacteraceae bacterium]|nr:FecR domain-containing protein [Prolixibacteraceae bacterium]